MDHVSFKTSFCQAESAGLNNRERGDPVLFDLCSLFFVEESDCKDIIRDVTSVHKVVLYFCSNAHRFFIRRAT